MYAARKTLISALVGAWCSSGASAHDVMSYANYV